MLSILRTLVPYMLRYRWRYSAGLTALLFRGALATALPYLLGLSIDALADGETSAAQRLAVLILVVAACKGITRCAGS